MKHLALILLCISSGFLSFNHAFHNPSDIKADSIKTFKVDDYPITNEQLRANSDKKINDTIVVYDQAWFTNDTLKQTIVFQLYTDYHRYATYHFYNNNIPTELIAALELHYENGNIAKEEDKRKNIKGLISQSVQIPQTSFKSNKGFKLGDRKEKALIIYGKPDAITAHNGIETYEWVFPGNILYDGESDLKGKPLAANSFGHTVTMFFLNKQLIAMVLFNDIP